MSTGPHQISRLTGNQMIAKFAAIIGILFLSALPFTTDVNLIVAPSPYSAPYFAAWAVGALVVYIRWHRTRMVREIALPLVIIFALLATGALFA